jgi:hypothetical protein
MQSQDPQARVWQLSCDEVNYGHRGERRDESLEMLEGEVRPRLRMIQVRARQVCYEGVLRSHKGNKEKRANLYGHLGWMAGAQ